MAATRCISCGTSLGSSAYNASRDAEDEALQHVDLEKRVAVATYERDTQAELACGLLRSSGIACEVSPMMIPGLTADLALWVNRQDEETAREILADVEQNAPSEELDE
jgi:hypothetical protein